MDQPCRRRAIWAQRAVEEQSSPPVSIEPPKEPKERKKPGPKPKVKRDGDLR
jgi:hypothetical protein